MNMTLNQHFYITSGEHKGARAIYKGVVYIRNSYNQFRFILDSGIEILVPHGYFTAV